jgi:hypothetical protein
MPSPIQHTPAPKTAFKKFTRLPDREPTEQQHGYPFKPHRLPEAPLETDLEEEPEEPVRRAAEGDDDLMSQDINATASDVPS